MPTDEQLFAKAVRASIPAVEAVWYPTADVIKPLPLSVWTTLIDPNMVFFAGRPSGPSELTKYLERGPRDLVPRDRDHELCAPGVESLETFREYMAEIVQSSLQLDEQDSANAVQTRQDPLEGSIGEFWNEDDSEIESKADVTSKPADDDDTANSQAIQNKENVAADAQADITTVDTAVEGEPENASAGPATPPGANANRAAAARLRAEMLASRAAPAQAQTPMPQTEELATASVTDDQELTQVIDRLHRAKMEAAPASDPAGDPSNPGWVKHQAGGAGHATLMGKILAKESEFLAELASGTLSCAQQACRQQDLQLCLDLRASNWFRGTTRNFFA